MLKKTIPNMEIISVVSTITAIVAYLGESAKEAGPSFFGKVGEEIFDKLKSTFTTNKEKDVIQKIEKGETDSKTMDIFEAFLESKLQTDETLLKIMSDVISTNKELVEKAQAAVINDYVINTEGDGNEILNNIQGKVTITKEFAKHIHFHGIHPDEMEKFDVKVNLTKLGGLTDEAVSREVENKLFLTSVLIKQRLYKEAARLVEEVIKIHAKISDAWEYKALLSYLIPKKNEVIDNSAKNIIIYLGAATMLRKEEKNTSPISYAQEISRRYSITLEYKIVAVGKSTRVEHIKNATLFKLINEYRTCYEIFPDNEYLKLFINYLIGGEGIIWLYNEEATGEKIYTTNYKGNELNLSDKNPTPRNIQEMVSAAARKIRETDAAYELPEPYFYSSKYEGVFSISSYFMLVKEKNLELGIRKSNLLTELKTAESNSEVIKKNIAFEANKPFYEKIFGTYEDRYKRELSNVEEAIKNIKAQIILIDSEVTEIIA